MSRQNRWLSAVLVLMGISASGCRSAPVETQSGVGPDPASVSAVDGSGQSSRIQLSADAAERIGLRTDTVRSLSAGQRKGTGLAVGKAAASPRLGVAVAALLYDHDGTTWVYVQTETRTFQRQRVVVSAVDGDLALLTSGPTVGTAVATVGVAELRGSEEGVPGE